MAGARLINALVTAVDAADKRISIAGRPPIPYDLLSINIGGEPDLGAIEGAAEHCIPVKPIGLFRQKLAGLTPSLPHTNKRAKVGRARIFFLVISHQLPKWRWPERVRCHSWR